MPGLRPRAAVGFGVALLLTLPAVRAPAGAAPRQPTDAAVRYSPELTETTRLDDRRAVVLGDRFYAVGTEAGVYPAMGFHTRGEMGGFWTPPIKVLDGLWFAVSDRWLGAAVPAEEFASGWGYTRTSYAEQDGVSVTRTDFAPDGLRAGLVGLTITGRRDGTVPLRLDAHSELMSAYPWGETTRAGGTKPLTQLQANLPDRGSVAGSALQFRDVGRPPVPGLARHDYAAVVGSRLRPVATRLGPDFRGPQDPAVICPASGPGTPAPPDRCDDTAYGRGTGGELAYQVRVRASRPTTVWFAVAGSDAGLRPARDGLAAALRDPAGLLADKVSRRLQADRYTTLDLPGDRRLQRSVQWSKQNLLDSVQESRHLALRVTNAGTRYPAPVARSGASAGSARAGRTTRGCSARTGSTPPSPASRWAASPTSPPTCARSATSARSSTGTAARSCTR